MPDRLLIPWSGGLDSTLLVARALDRTKLDVHANYTTCKNNTTKQWCEEQALEELKKQFDSVYRPITTHTGTIIDFPEIEQHGASFQPFMWMMTMIPVASTLLEDDSDLRVQIGYIKTDDALEHFDRIDAAWKTIWDQVLPEHPAPILEAPLKHMEKADVLRALRRFEASRGITLVDNIWTCEQPQTYHSGSITGYQACGKCKPCQNDPRSLTPSRNRSKKTRTEFSS